jgi:hypothetical protein
LQDGTEREAVMSSRQPEGIRVRGGSVRAEIRRYRFGPPAVLAIGGPGSIPQDVVVRDENGCELYREGPFNSFAIGGQVSRVAAEIEREDLEAFMRRQHVENAQLGPVEAPSGRRSLYFGYLRARIGTIFHRGERH